MAFGFVDRRSIQLSYSRIKPDYRKRPEILSMRVSAAVPVLLSARTKFGISITEIAGPHWRGLREFRITGSTTIRTLHRTLHPSFLGDECSNTSNPLTKPLCAPTWRNKDYQHAAEQRTLPIRKRTER